MGRLLFFLFRTAYLMQQDKSRYEIQGRHLYSRPPPEGYLGELLDCRREREIADLKVRIESATARAHIVYVDFHLVPLNTYCNGLAGAKIIRWHGRKAVTLRSLRGVCGS